MSFESHRNADGSGTLVMMIAFGFHSNRETNVANRQRNATRPWYRCFATVGVSASFLLCNLLADNLQAQNFQTPISQSRSTLQDGGARRGETFDNDGSLSFYSAKEILIPIQIAATGRQPSEIQLLYSDDLGNSWNTYDRSGADKRSFRFAADRDGIYWFSLRTFDERGLASSSKDQVLKIVVDTVQPQLKMGVDTTATGEVAVDCWIQEKWVQADEVRLEYQSDATLKWEPLPIEFVPGENDGEWVGTATWNPPRDAHNLIVRLSAMDRAGNRSEATRMYAMPRMASNGTLQLASQRPERFATRPDYRTGKVTTGNGPSLQHTPGASPWLPGDSRENRSRDQRSIAAAVGQPDPAAARPILTQGTRPSDPNRVVTGWAPSTPWPTNRSSDDRWQSDSIDPSRTLASSLGKPNRPSTSEESAVTSMARGSSNAGVGRLANVDNSLPRRESEPTLKLLSPGESAPSNSMSDKPESNVEELPAPQPVEDRIAEESSETAPSLADPASEPAKELSLNSDINADNSFSSRSKAFSLEYSVDLSRGSGVHAVELWGTTDEGTTWEKWGTDADRESPFDIKVQDEGLFGFRIVIVGSNLVAANEPTAGDPADAWVIVDTQAPEVKITSALYGEGEEAGNLVIEYSCSDPHLIDRPISLSFSDRVDGPWTTIVSGLKNTGRYLWPADPRLPKRILLRIEAVDSAGNVGTHRLDLPIEVEGLAPRGRIRGFRPISEEANIRSQTRRQ